MAMATDETGGQRADEPKAVELEELCRAVALRAHDVGWAAYLLGRAVAGQPLRTLKDAANPAAGQTPEGEASAALGVVAALMPRSQEQQRRSGALLDAEERLLCALVAVFERLGCLDGPDGLEWLDTHVSHELKMQMKVQGGRA